MTIAYPNYLIRIPAAGVGALVVTLGLFLLMHSLISTFEREQETTPIPNLQWVNLPEMTEPTTTRTRATPPPEPDVPPPPPNLVVQPGKETIAIGPGGKLVSPPAGAVTLGGFTDGPILTVVRVEPQYPRRAQARGITGYTIVEFDVHTDGSVRNARVIENDPDSSFDAASLEAIQRFRYKPKVVDGKPVIVTGMLNRFTFEMDRP